MVGAIDGPQRLRALGFFETAKEFVVSTATRKRTASLIDIPTDRIKKVVVVYFNPAEVVTLDQREDIAAFQANNNVEVNLLDGLWCSANPANGWLNFHVELKP